MPTGERVKSVRCTKDSLRVDLLDGRIIIVPLARYPRLLHATPQQRANWKPSGGGYGIHWPDLDEDLSVEGLLRGLPAPRVSVQAEKYLGKRAKRGNKKKFQRAMAKVADVEPDERDRL